MISGAKALSHFYMIDFERDEDQKRLFFLLKKIGNQLYSHDESLLATLLLGYSKGIIKTSLFLFNFSITHN